MDQWHPFVVLSPLAYYRTPPSSLLLGTKGETCALMRGQRSAQKRSRRLPRMPEVSDPAGLPTPSRRTRQKYVRAQLVRAAPV